MKQTVYYLNKAMHVSITHNKQVDKLCQLMSEYNITFVMRRNINQCLLYIYIGIFDYYLHY